MAESFEKEDMAQVERKYRQNLANIVEIQNNIQQIHPL
jgi:hypothetical protein